MDYSFLKDNSALLTSKDSKDEKLKNLCKYVKIK
jgi:hypothetical protein